MGNAIFLVIGIILTLLLAIVWLQAVAGKAGNALDEKLQTKNAHRSKFERLNDVEGLLTVDEKKIRTYNIGSLLLHNTVEITFYNNVGVDVLITDIELNNKSIFAFAPSNLSYREKSDYALQVLKHSANEGALSRDIAKEVEEIILDVDGLNKYMKEGKVIQLGNQTEDYAWKF